MLFLPWSSCRNVKTTITIRFHERVQADLFFMWDKAWLLMIDEHLRYKLTDHLESKAPEHLLKCMNRTWFRYFGPMEYLVFDQEGAITSDLVGLTCDRYNIKRLLAGKDAHTVTGLAEAHIRLTKQVALKLWNDCRAQGLQVSQEDVIFEAAMSQNLMLN